MATFNRQHVQLLNLSIATYGLICSITNVGIQAKRNDHIISKLLNRNANLRARLNVAREWGNLSQMSSPPFDTLLPRSKLFFPNLPKHYYDTTVRGKISKFVAGAEL